MARTLLHQYWDIPEGTECHRKAYASTSVSGAVGEHRPTGPGKQRVQGGHRVTVLRDWESRRVVYGCRQRVCRRPWNAGELLYEINFVGCRINLERTGWS